MKKTLVALAVLAASGASMAQVTMTGNFSYGHISVTDGKVNAAGKTVTSSGMGVQTSEVYLNVKEDLGGGMGLSLRYGFGGLDRSGESSTQPYSVGSNGPVTGRNAILTLTTPFGAFTGGSVKHADWNVAIAGLGMYIDDISDTKNGSAVRLFGSRARRDYLEYAMPIGPVRLTAVHYESANDLGIGDGAEGSNLDGAAATTRSTKQRINQLTATYATKALMVNAQYLSYDNQWSPAQIGGDGNIDNVMRLGGTYNFGMAKVGLAVQVADYTGARKDTNTLLGVSVPLGAVTLGLNYGMRNVTDSTGGATQNGDRDGYILYAQYDLSKRTAFKFQYTDQKSSVQAGQENSTNTYAIISHSF